MEIPAVFFRNDTGDITLFNPTEYAYSLSKTTESTIQIECMPENLKSLQALGLFSEMPLTMVFAFCKNIYIYLPRMDYTKIFNYEQFRIVKAALDHECAHLLYPDYSYKGPNSPVMLDDECKILHRTAGIVDDIKIEFLLEQEHPDTQEDVKFLTDHLWRKEMVDLADAKYSGYGYCGDFTSDLSGSWYWSLQRHYRKASLAGMIGVYHVFFATVDGFDKFFNTYIVPLMDRYLADPDIKAFDAAKDTLALLREHYPGWFKAPAADTNQDSDSDVEECA